MFSDWLQKQLCSEYISIIQSPRVRQYIHSRQAYTEELFMPTFLKTVRQLFVWLIFIASLSSRELRVMIMSLWPSFLSSEQHWGRFVLREYNIFIMSWTSVRTREWGVNALKVYNLRKWYWNSWQRGGNYIPTKDQVNSRSPSIVIHNSSFFFLRLIKQSLHHRYLSLDESYLESNPWQVKSVQTRLDI